MIFSSVPSTCLEIAVKASKRRSDFFADPQEPGALLLSRGVIEMLLTSSRVMRVLTLPSVHSDPFDRLLLAQAIEEDLLLMTVDGDPLRYPSHVLDAR